MGSAAPSTPPLNLHNVQGDILAGLPSKTQTYVFFQIDAARVKEFRTQLAHLVPHITTTAQAFDMREAVSEARRHAARFGVPPPLLKLSGLNIVFSHKGLKKMSIDDSDIQDPAFLGGMLADAPNLGDPSTGTDGTPDWVPAFKHGVDGMFLATGECHQTVAEKISLVESIFSVGAHSATIHETLRISGDVRPGKEKGHEHFGFADGISQPAITGVDAAAHKGQDFVPQGVTLLGRDGDVLLDPSGKDAPKPITRPKWAADGSFLAFRYLFQLVPEFHTFLKRNPIPGLEPNLGSELLGARMVGRWPSGAPIDLAPTKDNLDIAKDPEQNNDFNYDFKNPDDVTTQDRCPFAAHTRKAYPRNDLEGPPLMANIDNRRILRRGIQFGPEVTAAEHSSGKTMHGRGLLFAAYQSNIVQGFQFIQQSWADNSRFPPNKGEGVEAGLDPIIGQVLPDETRSMIGTDPKSQSASLTLPTWVVPKGGEYFFSPSLTTLKKIFALGA